MSVSKITNLLVPLILLSATAYAQKASKYADQDSTCIKVKPTIKMESGIESKILLMANVCNEIFDIQIYKQVDEGHWFSSFYEGMAPGDQIRTGISLTGRYIIYKRLSGSKAEFPDLAEIEKRNP